MSASLPKKIAFCSALFAIIVGAFVYGFLVSRFRIVPYNHIVRLEKNAARTINVLRHGEQGYVRSQIAQQLSPQIAHLPPTRKTIETALLPISIAEVSLADNIAFPAGGGALTVVADKIMVMDRLGKLYLYENGRIVEAKMPPVPNGLDGFILKSRNLDLTRDTFRAHSIAYDKKRGVLFASFEKYVSPRENAFSIAALTIDPITLVAVGAWRTIYESKSTNSVEIWGLAGGGKLLINRDVLYFAVGDYSIYRHGPNDKHAAQDRASPFGKIYSYNLSDGAVVLKSIGHRNTQGLVMTREGELLNVEHGPQGGDEINVIKDGKNYGWPIATYGTEYGTYTWPLEEKTVAEQLELPLFAFVPSIAISSIIQIGDFSDRWSGDVLVGSLKAQSLYRLKYVSGRVIFSEPIWIGHRIRDMVDLGRKIYLLTDDALILELLVDEIALKKNLRSVDAEYDKSVAKCMMCHHFGQTDPTSMAPTLSNLNHKKIASDTFGEYSSALKSVSGEWSRERLLKFISDPGRFAPGTAMPMIDISFEEAQSIVDQLIGPSD